MATVTMPVAMNVSVATMERGDSRDRPQTPCPLVQPEPTRVPTPTARPASARAGRTHRITRNNWTCQDRHGDRADRQPGDEGDGERARRVAAQPKRTRRQAADAGDPAGAEQHQCSCDADQQAAEQTLEWHEVGRDGHSASNGILR